MATITVPIALTTLTAGIHEFGPLTLDNTHRQAVLTIDRTVAGGLNSQTSVDSTSIDIWLSIDAGISWIGPNGGTVVGGIQLDKTGSTRTSNVLTVGLGTPEAGRLLKGRIVVALSTGVAGSLAVS